ncbi:tRNA-dihydrouridine synthase [Oceanimonas baumannii]|uniref:tRNA-dihydrouridine(16) synthase n=1 Tax=Oceanimonas baumannii TaxID=129578 RepID=A0A235CAA5_9GAMM|nr:tRNA-dihydrouridine synthase [Oceanimonas baumannii]OYD21346.1 tRNA dihydrouridine(16) synthase DusC [Oceanimonas baumannii]TDW55768.1 tRNA-dihydrouridine synthase C [Oceanimonas baumannii]
MRLILAPMEGVLDHLMRDLLTRLNPYDLCVTEFVRVVNMRLPPRVFYRLCPELHHGCNTPAGTPVRIQLLGQDADWLAENAEQACRLGANGIDLNFGCPAKTVNKHRGGAALLADSEQLYRIGRAVRAAVPAHLPVSAKIRLGLEERNSYLENSQALAEAGINELTVHARSKKDGYRPPAYWSLVTEIQQRLTIPVVINGEIWHADHATQARAQSGCSDIMLGRGALALPNLADTIKTGAAPMSWQQVIALLLDYSALEVEGNKAVYYPNRIKQWLNYLKLQYPEARELFTAIRTLKHTEEIRQELAQQAPLRGAVSDQR